MQPRQLAAIESTYTPNPSACLWSRPESAGAPIIPRNSAQIQRSALFVNNNLSPLQLHNICAAFSYSKRLKESVAPRPGKSGLQVSVDTALIERALRPAALTRKAHWHRVVKFSCDVNHPPYNAGGKRVLSGNRDEIQRVLASISAQT